MFKKTPEEQKETLDRSLTNIKPDENAIRHIEHVRSAAKALGYEIIDLCPDSREKSLALTKLEEVVMWAVKSIVLGSEKK